MAEVVGGDGTFEPPVENVVCPHCKKTFTAQLIAGAAERYRGFKCPHCRLFVPAARGDRSAAPR
jgi:DNA-directed RNA polymerase subunit RPC12/RpoP